MAAQASLTTNSGGTGRVQLAQAMAQFVERNANRTGQMAAGVFFDRSHIHQLASVDLGGHDRGSQSAALVLCDKGGLMQGILGTAKLRGVRQIEGSQIVDGSPKVQQRGNHVEAFIDAGAADRLALPNPPALLVIHKFHPDRRRTGIIARMMIGGDERGVYREAGGPGGSFGETRGADAM